MGNYVKIPLTVLEGLMRVRISGEENQVLHVILRKTYGWGKKSDTISISQFYKETKIKKPNIIRAIKKLLSKKIITVIKNDNKNAGTYAITEDHEKWKSLSKKITLSKTIKRVIKKDNTVIKNDNLALSKMIPTKNTITKNTTTNNTITKNTIFGDSYESPTTANTPPPGANLSQAPKTKREKSASRFKPPELREVEEYFRQRYNAGSFPRFDHSGHEKFHDYYSANGWRVGKNPMKDWKAAARLWIKKEQERVGKIYRA